MIKHLFDCVTKFGSKMMACFEHWIRQHKLLLYEIFDLLCIRIFKPNYKTKTN
jgi:hypothetical protein